MSGSPRNWTEYRLLHSPSGRRRLEAELRQKGVDAHIVDRVLSELLPPEVEQRLCVEAAVGRARRLHRGPPESPPPAPERRFWRAAGFDAGRRAHCADPS